MKIKTLTTTILILVFMASMPQFAHAAPSTVTSLIPTADTYVDSSKPTTNFGSGTLMWIDASSPTRRALLRFSLSSIPAGSTINSAVLKLYVTADGSSVAGSVKTVGSSWSESSVTYSTAPAVGSTIASIAGRAAPGATLAVDITSYVVGKSTVNLYLTTSSTDGVQYYSREKGGSLAPRLVVTWSPAATATPGPTSTVAPTLTPTKTATPPPTGTPAPTSSPTPTSTGPAPASLALPLRLAFYDDSYPESWGVGAAFPYANYT